MDSSLNRSVIFLFSIQYTAQEKKKNSWGLGGQLQYAADAVCFWEASGPVSLCPPSAAAAASVVILVLVSVFVREVRVEVAVHPLLRNHGMAEGTFVGAAALRRRHLRPHVNCLAQLGPPERLQRKAALISY